MRKNLLSSIKVLVKQRRVELALFVFLLAGLVSSIKVVVEQKRVENLLRIRAEKEAERDKLMEMSIKYPDYRDLLYRLAAAQWELGNEEAAREALTRAEYLDPNNPMLINIVKTLGLDYSLK